MTSRMVIELTPMPDGTIQFAMEGPDDPLAALEMLNFAMKQMLMKAIQEREPAPRIQVAHALPA